MKELTQLLKVKALLVAACKYAEAPFAAMDANGEVYAYWTEPTPAMDGWDPVWEPSGTPYELVFSLEEPPHEIDWREAIVKMEKDK